LLTPEEIINETIATALGESVVKPERLALEPWLYRLAMGCLDDLAAGSAENESAVSLQQRAAPPNVQASDEAQLQFHQPDEAMATQDHIPDRGTATPEEIAYSDEMIAMVEAALCDAGGKDREAFLLYAVEGFSPEEIAVISNRPIDQIRNSILAAREHLRKALPVPEEFKQKLLQQTKIA
jgi:DNA-directed RNA polymerase specialized sigma24 family protein